MASTLGKAVPCPLEIEACSSALVSDTTYDCPSIAEPFLDLVLLPGDPAMLSAAPVYFLLNLLVPSSY